MSEFNKMFGRTDGPSTATQFAIDQFKKEIGREPTAHEQRWVGRWEPHSAVRLAGLNPEGEPDALVPVKIEQSENIAAPYRGDGKPWENVVLYAELTVAASQQTWGKITGFRSLRYHDSDDSLWPMRDAQGELLRDNGGHLIQSPTFVAPHMMVEPISRCSWPEDVAEKDRGMWHLEMFVRPLYTLIGTSIDNRRVKNLVCEPCVAVLKNEKKMSREELETEVSALKLAVMNLQRARR